MNSQLGKILIILFIIFLKFAYSETINPSSEIIFILSFDIFFFIFNAFFSEFYMSTIKVKTIIIFWF